MAVKINKKVEEKKWIKEFARRLKKRMKELKMTQAELAELTGVANSAIYYYVYAKHIPSAHHALRIARVLDMDIRDLIDF
jgi:transcriptional regulator with XRE-family HTH domain